ncbi:MAG: MarR family transcriptional regulator [Euryarchaeota archaeon]|nr:MarR family transcriptional regulator [Euryarchaeota archaeon]
MEYIHPYGRGFLIYTDKEWTPGSLALSEDVLQIVGEEIITIPLKFVVSIDKSINLPVRREGRAFLLIEYANIKRRETVYLLISSEERFIRRVRFEILKRITVKTKVMYSSGESWVPGYMFVEDYTLIFKGPRVVKIGVEEILDVARTNVKYGLNKVGVILITYQKEGEKKKLGLFVQPIKRVFFWQLIQQMVDDYLNSKVVNDLSNLEKQVVHLVTMEWKYEDIMRKLELTSEDMEKILEKLVRYGLVQKIVILKVTERGKKVMSYLSEEFPQLS